MMIAFFIIPRSPLVSAAGIARADFSPVARGDSARLHTRRAVPRAGGGRHFGLTAAAKCSRLCVSRRLPPNAILELAGKGDAAVIAVMSSGMSFASVSPAPVAAYSSDVESGGYPQFVGAGSADDDRVTCVSAAN